MTESGNSDVVILDAKPDPINIEPSKTAVLVVDMQNDFGSKGGMFDRAGLDISMIQSTVRPTSKVLASARQNGIAIVYLKMGFRPDLSDLGASGSPNRTRHLHFGVGQRLSAPDGSEGRFLVRDTWNTDIVPELEPESGDIVIYKNRFSGFFETELDDVLRRRGTKYLIVTGMHDKRVRRVDGKRCHVPRLFMCALGRLYGRAYRK
jgi:ureidoacrylate peracid hydrolase